LPFKQISGENPEAPHWWLPLCGGEAGATSRQGRGGNGTEWEGRFVARKGKKYRAEQRRISGEAGRGEEHLFA